MKTIEINVANPGNATDYYRAKLPFYYLQMYGYRVCYPKEPIDHEITFISCPSTPEHYQKLKKSDFKWVDIDDIYSEIGGERHSFIHYRDGIYWQDKCLQIADLVTVSTQAIADKISHLNNNIHVLKNSVDHKQLTKGLSKNRFVFFRGSMGRVSDLTEANLKDCGVPFIFTGLPPISGTVKKYIYLPPTEDIDFYFQRSAHIAPMFSLNPRRATEFNKGISNIAEIEAVLCGSYPINTTGDANESIKWHLEQKFEVIEKLFNQKKEEISTFYNIHDSVRERVDILNRLGV